MNSVREKLFNPFAVFGRKVQRKFLIQPRDYGKYTNDQLLEEMEHELRIFNIDGIVWYLAKDVCSFLGITPDNSARKLKSIDKMYIRQENIRLELTSKCDVSSKRTNQITTMMYLVNEPGIYALIQKSRTVYAEQFKSWLNEQVLPSIRKKGEYKAGSVLTGDIALANATQDQREWELECMDSKEEQEYKEEIENELLNDVENLQAEINVATTTIFEQTEILHQKETDVFSMLKNIQLNMQRNEEKREAQRVADDIQHQKERAQDLEDKRQMKQDLAEMKAKINIIIKDRIVAPPDDTHRELFVIMATGEQNFTSKNRSNWRFPFYTLKCQQRTKKTRESSCVEKYPQAQNVFEIAQPNNQSLYDVIKSKAVDLGIHVTFYRNCFYFEDNTVTLQNLIDLVHEIERERTRV